jgi:hypothetical protein
MYAAHSEFVHSIPKAAPHELILVGGASSASTIIIRLAEQVRQNGLPRGGLTIRCFDKNGFANGGIAYGHCSDHHILNSVRTEMSPWRVVDFHQYCQDNGLGSCREDFNRRKDYNGFIASSVDQALDFLAGSGVTFIHHPNHVFLDAERDGSYTLLDAQTNLPLLLGCKPDQLVLTVGYGPNHNFEQLKGEWGYIHSLYESGARAISFIPDGANITFIGRGPALYDFVNDLKGAGLSNVNLTVLSRSAYGPLSVRDVAIEANEVGSIPKFILEAGFETADDLRAKVSHAFKNAASPRRLALDILKNIGPALKSMDTDEARKFQSSQAMDTIRHAATPVPLQSHVTLSSFNPAFIQANIGENSITVQKDGFVIDAGGGRVVHADYIVNGTGHGRHNAPILENLKNNRLAFVNASLNILDIDDTGYRLSGSGIACIGPSTNAGCDGVETFDAPSKLLVEDLWKARAHGHNLMHLSA